jgi:hypothetical protein
MKSICFPFLLVSRPSSGFLRARHTWNLPLDWSVAI